MSDELRQAAERLRRHKDGESLGTIYARLPLWQFESDRASCVNAYLATVAVDDGGFIDSSWLKSQGLVEYVPARFHLPKGTLNLECDAGAWMLMAAYHNCGQLETRGQLRQLCRALGIELKPSGQEQAK